MVLRLLGFPSWSKELSLVEVPDFRAFEETEERLDLLDFDVWDGGEAPDVAEKYENGFAFWNSVRRVSSFDIVDLLPCSGNVFEVSE